MYSAQSGKQTLIVPDKDADGLSSGAILRHTLKLLGLPAECIDVQLLSKGHTIHSDSEREQMAAHKPAYIFIVDHGSRSGPPVIDTPDTKTLIIDHHHATDSDFPKGSEHVTACFSPPVATSSLLTYEICEPLHQGVRDRCAWLCIVGTHGDLGNTLKWEPPFPDMREAMKRYTKKVLNDVVSLINAPRRTATYDVSTLIGLTLCDFVKSRSHTTARYDQHGTPSAKQPTQPQYLRPRASSQREQKSTQKSNAAPTRRRNSPQTAK